MRVRKKLGVCYVLMVLLTIAIVIPIIWLVFISMKPNSEIMNNPLSLPNALDFGNYVSALQTLDLFTLYKNTAFIAVCSLAVEIVITFSSAVGLIALTLLGGLITDFGSAFCFTVSFLFLRERTGGYHAKTEWQCALYSAAMIFAAMFALPIFAEEPNNYWAIMIVSSAVIWVSSPADNKQIHLSRAESKAMAKRARLRLLLLDAVSLTLLGVHGRLFANSIALAELSVAISLVLATAGFGIQ